jgi:hypothetical protein
VHRRRGKTLEPDMLAQTRESIGDGGGRPLQAHRLHRGCY